MRVATAANGGSSTGDGTASDPVDTVAGGIAKAVTLGWTQVDVSQGTYNEGNTGVALVSNINIAGGWDSSFATQTGANTTTVIQGGQQAALADGDTGITISQIMLAGFGASSVTATSTACARSTARTSRLTNVKVTAAAGFDGLDGTVGGNGVAGGNGAAGGNGTTGTSAARRLGRQRRHRQRRQRGRQGRRRWRVQHERCRRNRRVRWRRRWSTRRPRRHERLLGRL